MNLMESFLCAMCHGMLQVINNNVTADAFWLSLKILRSDSGCQHSSCSPIAIFLIRVW
jgi:hypothetical protein